jgi:hypothetical protein
MPGFLQYVGAAAGNSVRAAGSRKNRLFTVKKGLNLN